MNKVTRKLADVLYIVIFILFGGILSPSRSLDEVFTYNHLALMYLQSLSYICIYIYIYIYL